MFPLAPKVLCLSLKFNYPNNAWIEDLNNIRNYWKNFENIILLFLSPAQPPQITSVSHLVCSTLVPFNCTYVQMSVWAYMWMCTYVQYIYKYIYSLIFVLYVFPYYIHIVLLYFHLIFFSFDIQHHVIWFISCFSSTSTL